MEKRCIICKELPTETNPITVEHIIPEAIGGKFKFRQVCKNCNSRLGDKIDCEFTDNDVIVVARYKLKIKGKDKSVPNPFPKTIDLPVLGLKGQIITSKKGDIIGLNVFNKPIVLDNMVIVPSSSSIKDVKKAEKVALEKGEKLFPRMVPRLEKIQIDISQYRPKLVLKNIKKKEVQEEFLKKNWFLELVKIGYEMTFFTFFKHGLGCEYLCDSVANEMRGCLHDYIGSQSSVVVVPCDIKNMHINTDSESWNCYYKISFEKRKVGIICKVNLMNIVFGEIVVAEALEEYDFIYSISYNGELV